MAIEKVRAFFAAHGMEDRILEFPVSSATVALAAEALGCEPARIAKSMSFLVDEEPVLVVLAGDARVANPKFKETFHVKASMLPAEQVESL